MSFLICSFLLVISFTIFSWIFNGGKIKGEFKNFAQSASSGTTNRQRIKEENFLNIKIPLPSLKEQREIIEPIIENLKQQNEAQKNRELAIKEFEMEIFQTESEKVS